MAIRIHELGAERISRRKGNSVELEPLGTFRLRYDADGLTLVKPFAGHEAQGFGAGTGEIDGERLSGPIRWANYPRMRDDGVLMPDARGVIDAQGGPVLFELHGYSLATSVATTRRVVATINFRSEVERHRWLNDAIAVHEGSIDFTDMSTEFPAFICVPGDL